MKRKIKIVGEALLGTELHDPIKREAFRKKVIDSFTAQFDEKVAEFLADSEKEKTSPLDAFLAKLSGLIMGPTPNQVAWVREHAEFISQNTLFTAESIREDAYIHAEALAKLQAKGHTCEDAENCGVYKVLAYFPQPTPPTPPTPPAVPPTAF